MTILPPDGAQFRQVLGDSYAAWAAYQKTLKPGSDVLAEFSNWASVNLDPGTAQKAYVTYAQLLNGVIGTAVKNVLNPQYVDATNGPVFSKTIQNLNDALKSAAGRSFNFDSSTASSQVSDTWAKGSVSGFYEFFTGEAGGSFEQLSTKASESRVTVNASFKRVMSFAAAPGGWYSSAALNVAYNTSDNTVWPAGQQPDWNATFGPSGNLLRLATELVVVDGIDITITSCANYSTEEQRQISASGRVGYWPFFSASASGGSTTTATFDDSGTMTVKTSVPLGNPAVLGVNVLPIGRALGH